MAKLVHTLVPRSKATKFSSLKIARDGRLEEMLMHKDCTQLGMSFYSSTKGTLLICMCRRQKKWLDEQPSLALARRSTVF